MGRDYQNLTVWQRSYDLVVMVYPMLNRLPDVEEFNLKDQTRRAVTSIAVNIAEGCSSRSNKIFLQHLNYSYGSAKELEVLLRIAHDVYRPTGLDDIYDKLDVVKKMLYGLMRSVEREIKEGKTNFSTWKGSSAS